MALLLRKTDIPYDRQAHPSL